MVDVKIKQRFWKNVDDQGPERCWPWRGSKKANGYGQIWNKKPTYAHRLSWEIHKGPIPYKQYVLHTCDNPECTNPNHLFLGSQDDNMKDKIKKHRGKKSKFTYAQRQEMKKLVREKTKSREDICKQFGISNTYLSTLINRTHVI